MRPPALIDRRSHRGYVVRRGQEKQDISDSSQSIYIPLICTIIGTYPSLRPKKAIRDPGAGLLTSLHRRARLLSSSPMAHCAQLHNTAAVLSENLTPFPLARMGSPVDFRYSVFRIYYTMYPPICKGRIDAPCRKILQANSVIFALIT